MKPPLPASVAPMDVSLGMSSSFNRSSGSRASSRAPSVSDDEQEGLSHQPLSARGMEEHRCDPALRAALEKLDAVRRRQPTFDDFAIEHFMSSAAQLPDTRSNRAPPMSNVQPRLTGPMLRNCFSTDLLLLAAVSQRGTIPPPYAAGEVVSRSTSPGSTALSSGSCSGGSFSGGSVSSTRAVYTTQRSRAAGYGGGRSTSSARRQPSTSGRGASVEAPREPLAPSGVPPRRPGRQHQLSARSNRLEGVDATVEPQAMYSAR